MEERAEESLYQQLTVPRNTAEKSNERKVSARNGNILLLQSSCLKGQVLPLLFSVTLQESLNGLSR